MAEFMLTTSVLREEKREYIQSDVDAPTISASSSYDHMDISSPASSSSALHPSNLQRPMPASDHGLNSPPPPSIEDAPMSHPNSNLNHPPASSSSHIDVSVAPSPSPQRSHAGSSASLSSVIPSPVPSPSPISASSSSSSLSSAPSSLPLDLPPMKEYPPIKLGRTAKERVLYEQLGDLYSLIVTTEHLELAYVRDAISEQAYANTCQKLIAQYKTLRESMGSSAPELDAFCKEYGLECRAGENRLQVGVPATIVHGDNSSAQSGSNGGNKMEVAVFHTVQHFITCMDSLKLNMRAVDELHPTLTELVDSVNKVPGLAADHESKQKTVQWLTTLHRMKAHEELTEEQARQMSFDLDSAYNAFHRFVQGK